MTVLYSNNFESYAQNAVLAEFTADGAAAFSVQVNGSSAPGGANAYGRNSDGDQALWTGNTALGASGIRFAQRFSATSSIAAWLRKTLAVTKGYQFGYDVSSGTATPYIWSRDSGTVFKTTGTAITGLATSDIMHLEATAVGWVLELRVWKEGTARPSTPTVTVNDASNPYKWPTGAAGLRKTGAFEYHTADNLVIADGASGLDYFYAAPTGPTISAHPSNQSVTTPAAATFSVTAAASGGGSLSYQWQRNPGGNTSFANVSTGTGGTTSSYTTAATTITGGNANSADTWRCVVTETGGSNAGSANSNAATLTVSAGPTGPTINTQPGNQTVSPGSTASFSVAATTSGGALSYQWQRNGTNISGAAAATYTTPAATVTGGSANNGDTYRCNVTDSNGTTTSSSATLTVNAAAATVSWVLKNNTGTLLASATVPKVKFLRVSDMVSILDLTNQSSATSTAVMTATNAAFTSGIDYLVVCCDATGANVGVQKVTAT